MVETLVRRNPPTAIVGGSETVLETSPRLARVTGEAPTLVLMAGFAGAGKTTLARWLSNQSHWEILNKDDLKLERLAQGESVAPAEWEAFVEQAGRQAFIDLLNLIEEKVMKGQQSVIIDTSNEKPLIFEDILAILKKVEALNIHAQLKIILCVASKETRTVRLQERGSVFAPHVRELPSIRDDSELSERFKHLPMEKTLTLDTNQPLEAYKQEALQFLKQPEA